MADSGIFGWKNVKKFYGFCDFLYDSIVPIAISLILLIINYYTNKDMFVALQKAMDTGMDLISVILTIMLAAYAILISMYWSSISKTMKKVGCDGVKLLNDLNSAFAASIIITTLSVIILLIFNVIGDINIRIPLETAHLINSVLYVFVMYIILFPVWLVKDIAIDLYNIAAFSINYKEKESDDIPASTLIAIYMGLGEKEKAREALIEHIVNKSDLRDRLYRIDDADSSLKPYRELMKELNINFDAVKAKDIKKKL